MSNFQPPQPFALAAILGPADEWPPRVQRRLDEIAASTIGSNPRWPRENNQPMLPTTVRINLASPEIRGAYMGYVRGILNFIRELAHELDSARSQQHHDLTMWTEMQSIMHRNILANTHRQIRSLTSQLGEPISAQRSSSASSWSSVDFDHPDVQLMKTRYGDASRSKMVDPFHRAAKIADLRDHEARLGAATAVQEDVVQAKELTRERAQLIRQDPLLASHLKEQEGTQLSAWARENDDDYVARLMAEEEEEEESRRTEALMAQLVEEDRVSVGGEDVGLSVDFDTLSMAGSIGGAGHSQQREQFYGAQPGVAGTHQQRPQPSPPNSLYGPGPRQHPGSSYQQQSQGHSQQGTCYPQQSQGYPQGNLPDNPGLQAALPSHQQRLPYQQELLHAGPNQPACPPIQQQGGPTSSYLPDQDEPEQFD